MEANYEGVYYEAEVISMPRFRSTKALRILNGPAAGKVSRSPTGAMLNATKKQRKDDNLGKKGVANGWSFWKVRDGG